MALAREIVDAYHGADAAQGAEAEFRRIFQEGDVPEELPEYTLSTDKSLLDVLVDAGLASSRSEGRRLIEQRGVRLDDAVLEDPNEILVLGEPAILRVGKRRFIRLVP
jgi:tyrosyl-tRNA synthetase